LWLHLLLIVELFDELFKRAQMELLSLPSLQLTKDPSSHYCNYQRQRRTILDKKRLLEVLGKHFAHESFEVSLRPFVLSK